MKQPEFSVQDEISVIEHKTLIIGQQMITFITRKAHHEMTNQRFLLAFKILFFFVSEHPQLNQLLFSKRVCLDDLEQEPQQ